MVAAIFAILRGTVRKHDSHSGVVFRRDPEDPAWFGEPNVQPFMNPPKIGTKPA
jgi:hypothetical protein